MGKKIMPILAAAKPKVAGARFHPNPFKLKGVDERPCYI